MRELHVSSCRERGRRASLQTYQKSIGHDWTEEKTLSDRQSVSTQPPSAHITGSNILEEGAK
jgi:hypothetical protein